jgi:hypothetical protein
MVVGQRLLATSFERRDNNWEYGLVLQEMDRLQGWPQTLAEQR